MLLKYRSPTFQTRNEIHLTKTHKIYNYYSKKSKIHKLSILKILCLKAFLFYLNKTVSFCLKDHAECRIFSFWNIFLGNMTRKLLLWRCSEDLPFILEELYWHLLPERNNCSFQRWACSDCCGMQYIHIYIHTRFLYLISNTNDVFAKYFTIYKKICIVIFRFIKYL